MFGVQRVIDLLETILKRVSNEDGESLATLRASKVKLDEQIEKLKLKKKIEEEDIKHMVKMKEEKLDLAHEKKMLELERKKEAEISKLREEYRDKAEKQLEKETTTMKEMYGQILKRLPNMNVKLNGDITEK